MARFRMGPYMSPLGNMRAPMIAVEHKQQRCIFLVKGTNCMKNKDITKLFGRNGLVTHQ